MTDLGARFPAKVTFHDGCHGLRELGIKKQPRALLAKVRDLQLIEMSEAETCCGFGGIFSVVYPEVSMAMMEAKVMNIMASNAECVVVSEPGCLINIRGGLQKMNSNIRAMHLIEILAQEGAA